MNFLQQIEENFHISFAFTRLIISTHHHFPRQGENPIEAQKQNSHRNRMQQEHAIR